MFILIEYNNFYEKNLEELKKYNYTAVTLFKIILNNKIKIKEDILKIKTLINKLNPKYTAIQIIIEKQDNSTVGIVNNLKQDFDITIGLGGLNKINRFFLEQTQVDFLQDPQNTKFKSKIDFIHHLNSGINHILGKFAKEKSISYIFSLNFISTKPLFRAKELGRINQNLKFARKYHTRSIINFIIQTPNQIKSKIDLKGIISFFKLSTTQEKESFEILEKKIKLNKKKKSKESICDGIIICD